MMPLTPGAQIDELRRLLRESEQRRQAAELKLADRERQLGTASPNDCYPRSPYRQNDCRTRAAAGRGDSDRAQRLRARLPALIQEQQRPLTPPLVALWPERLRVLLMISMYSRFITGLDERTRRRTVITQSRRRVSGLTGQVDITLRFGA